MISRKDIDNLYYHHVLHSLALSLFHSFKPDQRILDFGTGGGFPGIPLAILYPECQFHCIDSKKKKLKVLQSIADAINLTNISTEHIRIGQNDTDHLKRQFDYITARATGGVKDVYDRCKSLIDTKQMDNEKERGFFIFKGGDIEKDIAPLQQPIKLYPLYEQLPYDYYQEKYIIYIPVT